MTHATRATHVADTRTSRTSHLLQANCATDIYVNTGVCEEPKYPNDLGGRLGISALPDVFKWQSLADVFVLLLLVLAAKGIFTLRFLLRNGLSQVEP